jgi:succinoglycan biosynthesis protein ExoV
LVIAEAMHGAIVSDALRVPWIPVMPFRRTHRFKWFDWAESLNIDLVAKSLIPSSISECWVLATQREGQRIANPGRLLTPLFNAVNLGLNHAAAARLKQLAKSAPMLSSDRALSAAIDRLEEEANNIKREFS